MCLFCQIVKKEIPASVIYEDEGILVFKDIAPKADIHLLFIPKKHIKDLYSIKEEDKEVLSHLLLKIPDIAKELGVDYFRIITNSGTKAGQVVFHLHFHFLSGENMPKAHV
jgi:histidine triad (HIT) family protein